MPSDPTTTDLVVRAQRGEADAFAALGRAYLRTAYSVALATVGRPADAEDVAQDSLIIALERIDTCREPERFGSWLLQIVRNQSKNWLDRRRLRDVPASDHVPELVDAAQPLDGAASRDQLLGALCGLDPVRCEIVLLHDLEGWTHPEIADALNLSETNCRQHLFQARRKLRAALDGGKP